MTTGTQRLPIWNLYFSMNTHSLYAYQSEAVKENAMRTGEKVEEMKLEGKDPCDGPTRVDRIVPESTNGTVLLQQSLLE